MTEPIYANNEHRVIIETYITMCKEFAKEVSTKTRYNNYLEVVEIILECSFTFYKNMNSNIYSRTFHSVLIINTLFVH